METNNPLLQSLGWSLAHSLWQGALIAACAKLLLAFLNPRYARARYAICYGAMLLVLASFCFTFSQLQREPQSSTPIALPVGPTSTADLVVAREFAVASVDWVDQARSIMPWLAAAWLIGVAILGIRQAASWIGLCKLRNSGERLTAGTHRELIDKICEAWHLPRSVELRQSLLAKVPMTFGWLRPVVLLPASLITQMTPSQVEALIWHEMAHIRRNDYLMNLFQVLIENLFYYHPAVKWLGNEARKERENCCDDIASQSTGDIPSYARTLEILEQLRSGPQLGLAASDGNLLGRVRRLSSWNESVGPSLPVGGVGAGLLAAICIAALLILPFTKGIAEEQSEAALQFRLVTAEEKPAEPFDEFKTSGGQILRVLKKTLLDSRQIAAAKVETDPVSNRKEVEVEFSAEGAKQFQKITRDSVGKQLAIVFRGKLLAAPRILSEIPGGKASISGNFSDEELAEMEKAIASDGIKLRKEAGTTAAPLIDEPQQAPAKTNVVSARSARGYEALKEEYKKQQTILTAKQLELDKLRAELGIQEMSVPDSDPGPSQSLVIALEEAKLSTLKLESTLSSTKTMNPRQRRTFLQSSYRNAVLESLLIAESKAKLEAINPFEPSNTAKARQLRLDHIASQIDEQIEDIVEGLKAQMEEKKRIIQHLTAQLGQDRAEQFDREKVLAPLRRAERELENQKKINDAIFMRMLQESVDFKIERQR